MNTIAMEKFNEAQKQEINWGLKMQIDVSLYAHPKLPSFRMKKTRLSLWRKRVDFYAQGLSPEQRFEVECGLMQGVDVISYASANILAAQMCEIRQGLVEGFSPSPDTNNVIAELRKYQMSQVLHRFPLVNADIFHGLTFSKAQTEEICIGSQAGLGAKLQMYACPDFDADQMREIRLGLTHSIDAESFAGGRYSAKEMREIRLALEKGKKKKKKKESEMEM